MFSQNNVVGATTANDPRLPTPRIVEYECDAGGDKLLWSIAVDMSGISLYTTSAG